MAYLPIIDHTTLYQMAFAPFPCAFFSISSPCSRARWRSSSHRGSLKTSSRNLARTSLRSCCFSSGVSFSICFLTFSMDTCYLPSDLIASLRFPSTIISNQNEEGLSYVPRGQAKGPISTWTGPFHTLEMRPSFRPLHRAVSCRDPSLPSPDRTRRCDFPSFHHRP